MISQFKQTDESTDMRRHVFGVFHLFPQLKARSSQIFGALEVLLREAGGAQLGGHWGIRQGHKPSVSGASFSKKSQKGVREGPAQSLCWVICAKKTSVCCFWS